MISNRYSVLLIVAFSTIFVLNTASKVKIDSSKANSNRLIKSNSNGGIYFSDIPLSDAEGSADGSDDDLDDASGKGDDDEDSRDNVDKEGSGDELPDTDSDNTDIELGSGEEPIFLSSTERPTKKPEVTKKPITPQKENESVNKETIPLDLSPILENTVPKEEVPDVVTPETSTRSVPSSTQRPKHTNNEYDSDDDNKLNNEVSIMGQKQVTPASFFARPGILAAVIGGAVVGLLCAILLVMFIVYRMRKKDEGSYALDEPKRSTSANPYARGASKEFYA